MFFLFVCFKQKRDMKHSQLLYCKMPFAPLSFGFLLPFLFPIPHKLLAAIKSLEIVMFILFRRYVEIPLKGR